VKYKICVSGAANTDCCAIGAKEKTIELGKEIVKQGGVLVTGATTGAPFWATIGTKKAKGFSIGMSPAATEIEHVKKYKLPTDNFDMIVYTGFGYSGRNLMLTRSADAVIIVCGRMGTLNEFTIAFEDRKPIGVLTGTGGTADRIEEIVKSSKRGLGKIVYSDDPKELVRGVIELIKKEKAKANDVKKK